MTDEPPLTGADLLWSRRKTHTPPPTNGTTPTPEPRSTTTTKYGHNALTGECGILATKTEGGRNEYLNIAAMNMGQLVAGGELNYQEMIDALTNTAHAIGLTPTETRNTIQSGYRKGITEPRTATPQRHLEPVPPFNPDTPYDPDTDGDDLPQPINWHELWADDTEDEWIIEPLLPARRGVALFSAPKVGKSLLMLELAAGIAAGRSVLGHPAQPPIRVLYVDYENDPRGDIRERLQDMNYTPDDLSELRYLSYPVLGSLDTRPGAAKLLAVCDREQPQVIIIDTISRAISGEENDNDTWNGFYRTTGLALKQRGIAYMRLDHSGKDQDKGMRGGSAKAGDVDAVWHMTTIVEGTTYRLECTHQRMPVVEKILTITRQEDPLHHKVEADADYAAKQAAYEACIELLDKINAPLGLSRTKLRKAVQSELPKNKILGPANTMRNRRIPRFEYGE